MSGIGSTAYGQSQYASSGFRLTGKKLLKEYIYFQEGISFKISKLFEQVLTLKETFTIKRIKEFIDNLAVSFKANISLHKTFIEITGAIQTGLQRISGVFSQDTLALTYKRGLSKITKVFKETLSFMDKLTRRLNGIAMGWIKKKRLETNWTKTPRAQTNWEKRDNLGTSWKKKEIRKVED